MTITVKFFASMRERMGKAQDSVSFEDAMRVTDVWRSVSGSDEWPPRMLCAVNLDYVSPDSQVADGDEVAFFPPVTGG